MCRNIRPLFNYNPPTTPEQVRDAALQYVRKVSGYNAPSRANQVAFERAVKRVAAATQGLIDTLVTEAPPRDRAAEIVKLRARNEERFSVAAALRRAERLARK